MIFLIESCKTPIYNRIAMSIVKTLKKFGHTVYFIDTSDYTTETFVRTINDINIDYYISTNALNFINDYDNNNLYFIFEKIIHKIVFIHHDSSFVSSTDLNIREKKLKALIYHQDKIFHFFIESSNVNYFKSIGINHCFRINHASEFKNEEINGDYKYDISFVGHLMSSLSLYPRNSLVLENHLYALAYNRLSNSSFSIQSEILKLIDNNLITSTIANSNYSKISILQLLLHEVTKLSMPYRGELIGSLHHKKIDIFGGDLSYGRYSNDLLKLKKENIYYHSATSNYSDTEKIYSQSKININISSLQFDSAINNRIIDIIYSGGFVLSDRRSDLKTESNLFNYFTFESPEEFDYLVNYYSDKNNEKNYLDLKVALQEEFKEKYSYEAVISYLLLQLPN